MKRTNVVIDEELIEEARKLTGLRTQRQLIDHALRELVRRKKAKFILQLRGKVDWSGDYGRMRRGRAR